MYKYLKKRDVWNMLHMIGGCDGSCDFDKGWDAAITEAISELDTLSTVKMDDEKEKKR